jgi:hypothetical protein
MSDSEVGCESRAASKRPARLGAAGRAVICTSIAALALAAFPALAAAITAAPIVVSPSATPTANGATLNATLYPYGLDTTYRFEYGTTSSYGTNAPVPDGDAGSVAYPNTVQVHQPVTGLTPHTTYHFRLVAQNSNGPAATSDQTFTTLAVAPGVVANAASPIAGGYELSGTVNPQGADAKYRFEYGTTTSYGSNIPSPDGDAGSGSAAAPVSQDLTALLPNTTYHFRLVAQNSGGSTPSSDHTFTTAPSGPAAPSVAVESPEAVAGGYRLKGAVNPNGLDTTYHFEFGTTTAYGTDLPIPDADIGAGESAVPEVQEVTGLTPNTTYHYRIAANNSDGPGTSSDQEFTTPPNPPQVAATAFSEAAGGFDLNGTVDPNGAETTYHFEFGFTTAYGSNIPASDADAGSGTSPVAVSQQITGLPPSVVYHYRLVAHNSGGTSTSGDQVFTTPPAAPLMSAPAARLVPPPAAPVPPPPTNRFTVRPAVARGTAATLRVSVPGPGKVSASGRGLKMVRVGSSGAGSVTLKLKLTSAGIKALKKARGHKLTVKVRITFQPAGGSPATASRAVTFKT